MAIFTFSVAPEAPLQNVHKLNVDSSLEVSIKPLTRKLLKKWPCRQMAIAKKYINGTAVFSGYPVVVIYHKLCYNSYKV